MTGQSLYASRGSQLLWGLGAITVGILFLNSPAMTARFIVQVLAVYWLVGGVIDVFVAVWSREGNWGWSIISGVVGIIIGFVILGHPLAGAAITVAILYIFLALSAILSGLTNIVGGSRRGAGKKRTWSLGRFFLGAIQLVIGILMFWHPIMGSLAFTTVLALFVIVGGMGTIMAAILGGRNEPSSR